MNPDLQSGSLTHSGPHPVIVSGFGTNPGLHLQIEFPLKVTVQVAPGPQGEGTHGSGFSTHFWSLQMKPCRQSGSLVHSGLHPVIVSGFGISPGEHLQIALPDPVTVQTAPGPQGFGSQGSGLGTHLWS